MNRFHLQCWLWFCLITACGASVVRANRIAVLPYGDPIYSSASGNRGWAFSVLDSPIEVTHLGVYDHDSDGLVTSHPVGIWSYGLEGEPTLVVSDTVAAGDDAELRDGFRFSPIEPTILPVNERGAHVIGAFFSEDNPDDQLVGVSDVDKGLPVFYHGARRSSGIAFAIPTEAVRIGADGDDAGYFGPNFLFVVPEPTSLTMLLTAALGFFAMRSKNASEIDT